MWSNAIETPITQRCFDVPSKYVPNKQSLTYQIGHVDKPLFSKLLSFGPNITHSFQNGNAATNEHPVCNAFFIELYHLLIIWGGACATSCIHLP